MTHLALVPSPVLGPAVWEPVAVALRSRGATATALGLEGDVRSPLEALDALLRALPEDPLVLVPHSGAGLLAPLVAARRPGTAVVFVDAALPPVAVPTTTAAPADLYALLAGKADGDGLLPVWTQWWDEAVDELFPDPATRHRVELQQRRLPLAYFHEPVPVPAGWAQRPCAYLAFGDTYADETATARACGWPVAVLAGHHLEMLRRPDEVADEVLALLSQIA